ncbi:DEAD/DEAH box helicase [archaeon]|nr:MAG: DEAD/DEAH box helicase [archaeon]
MDRLQYLCHCHPGIEHNANLYRALYPFPLDSFQLDGLAALTTGKNVVVMTPTGSGKTLVGELAIYYAVMKGLRVIYTTPLKALSNQKFADFKFKYGADRVGLMTGDLAINKGSQITVMTTEVGIYNAERFICLSGLHIDVIWV